MKYLYFAFICALLSSCGKNKVVIDSEFEPYLKGINTVSVKFGEFEGEPTIAGRCYYNDNLIVISSNHWKYLTEKQRQWLIDHEIGHCIEYLGHDTRMDSNNCPISKMHTHIPDNRCL